MFTGIIEDRGQIVQIERGAAFTRLVIGASMDLSDVNPGDSIAINGACLTAVSVEASKGRFAADVSPETLRVTTLGDLKAGSRVNLEKALRLDSRLGGHLVLGHVDCVGRVVEKRSKGPGWLMGFEADSGAYIIDKGSIAVDGVSLTVNKVVGPRFNVMIIPHTAALTGLTDKNLNDKVNLEYDVIGKYVEKLVGRREGGGGVDETTLKKYGFV